MIKRIVALAVVVTPVLAFAQVAAAPVAAPPSNTMQMVLANLFVLLQPLLAAAGLALASYLTLWVNSKVKNEKAAGVINRSKDLIFALVKKANQTIVAGIKAASEDGILTDEEKKQIKNAVLADFKEILGVTGLQAITYALGISGSAGALDKWLDTQIEAAVHDVKLVSAAAEKPASFP